MYSTRDIQARVNALCESKGIYDTKMRQDIAAHLLFLSIDENVDPSTTLSLLEDEDNLTPITILSNNFRCPIRELISDKLNADPVFLRLFERMLYITTRSIGVGEVSLPFILSGYKFIKAGKDEDGNPLPDGKHALGTCEVKGDNSSLKCMSKGAAKGILVDRLNDKYFDGNPPGMRHKKNLDAHVNSIVGNPYDTYLPYYTELYPGVDGVAKLAEETAKVYTDPDAFADVMGRFALRQYQALDGWYNLIFIKPQTMELINIHDPEGVDGLGLRFRPKFKRGGSTQAVADGHVDVKL